MKIEEAVCAVDAQLKAALSESTYKSRRCYLHQLLGVAGRLGIDTPCQELYDVFATDDYGSHERHWQLGRCIRLIDAVAETHAQRLDGTLYNEPSLPSTTDALTCLADATYPIGSVDVGILIVKAESEMGYLGLTSSTMGQYRHAWRDIYRYFFLGGDTVYSESVAKGYIADVTAQRDQGQMNEWKWKINRKAASVLIEVAKTGRFEWKLVKETPCCGNDALDDSRMQYLAILREHNLEESTVCLHDYVFRNALRYSNICTAQDLKQLCREHVQAMVRGFAAICNQRSLATILPILRRILDFLHANGFGESKLSGMVMPAFVQRCNVAGYVPTDEICKVVTQLEYESLRDKAIVLLALRLGLRDCDICSLTFQNIEWSADRISLSQRKTGQHLTLPLLADVGNALMDYIVNERPDGISGCSYVFLRQKAPHKKLASVYRVCADVAKRAGVVPVNGTALGAHLYRRTLVHRLLDAKIPHQVITDTLGHSSRESDKPYISMEDSMLRVCALDLSVIGSISWNREGQHNG